ncbi:magnesium transporter NIPA-domain-containing protein [Mycena leptocephala]|nr:magnesium transporter NIPA-domain-containing protein [Mycena leptocephala]
MPLVAHARRAPRITTSTTNCIHDIGAGSTSSHAPPVFAPGAPRAPRPHSHRHRSTRALERIPNTFTGTFPIAHLVLVLVASLHTATMSHLLASPDYLQRRSPRPPAAQLTRTGRTTRSTTVMRSPRRRCHRRPFLITRLFTTAKVVIATRPASQRSTLASLMHEESCAHHDPPAIYPPPCTMRAGVRSTHPQYETRRWRRAHLPRRLPARTASALRISPLPLAAVLVNTTPRHAALPAAVSPSRTPAPLSSPRRTLLSHRQPRLRRLLVASKPRTTPTDARPCILDTNHQPAQDLRQPFVFHDLGEDFSWRGRNQFIYPSTYLFGVISVVCIVIQLNYANNALDLFSVNLVNPIYDVGFCPATIVAPLILFKGLNTTSVTDTLLPHRLRRHLPWGYRGSLWANADSIRR